MFKKISLIISLLVTLILTSSFLNYNTLSINPVVKKNPPFYKYLNSNKVDSILSVMTLDQKIGQLFMLATYSNKGISHQHNIDLLIKKYEIGGLIFFQGGPIRELRLTNHYQSISKTPLMIAIDGEWGLSMRLDSTVKYPRQMILGAIKDEKLIYNMSSKIAKNCKLLGININFAPVIDINNNINNPVIGSRSFGDNRFDVARKGYFYMQGLQDNNILAVGKHFPGHGDTNKDSHKTLPIINHSFQKIDTLDTFPFKNLINNGLGGIMVAHLFIPALDSTANQATTLSKKVVTDYLQDKIGFKGLIFTDALNMKGVSSFNDPADVVLKALMAGNDVLLFPSDIAKSIEKIKQAVESGLITEEDIEKHVRKILAFKQWSGVLNFKPLSEKNLINKINSDSIILLNKHLVEASITVIKNDSNLLPLQRLDTLNIAVVEVGKTNKSDFQKTCEKYTKTTNFNLKKYVKPNEEAIWIKKLSKYNLVIFSLDKTNYSSRRNFGISSKTMSIVKKLSTRTNVIVNFLAIPYSVAKFTNNIKSTKAILVSNNDTKLFQNASAEVIFGAKAATGTLPVSLNKKFHNGFGIETKSLNRLNYTIPIEVNANEKYLKKIDSIAINGIRDGAYPGCQILIAKDGKVFYDKSFGYFTYNHIKKVNNSNIYDLASITKVMATTLSLMKLYEEGKFDLSKKISDYLPELDSTDKKNILIKDVLTHQARLTPWIPFYLKTIKKPEYKNIIYTNSPDKTHNTKVCNNMYILDTYVDTMYQLIASSKLRKKKEYRYSDLGFYWFLKIIKNQTKQNLDNYVENNFYKPLGAYNTTFNPLNKFNKSDIVPAEKDNYFRNCVIEGYCHDMGAAMMGGIGGHAGLFSNAENLAIIMQMLINKGTYGGKQYFKPETVKMFTKCQFCPENRRGLGFDKPLNSLNGGGPTCISAPPESFGHTGFTGTIIWGDPVNNIVYIFLSNRTYPTMENKKLIELNIRTEIQENIYKAFNLVDTLKPNQEKHD